jgi:hypothetical protein
MHEKRAFDIINIYQVRAVPCFAMLCDAVLIVGV